MIKCVSVLFLMPVVAAALPDWHQVECPYSVSTAVVDSDSQAWAAGTAGSYLSGFYRWEGAGWTLTDTFRNQLVYDICTAGTDAWAVGEQFNFPDGVVFRWDGEHWQQQDDPFDRALQAVAFPDSAHGFAAGAAPVTHHPVMRYADGEWRLDSSLTTNRILTGLTSPWSDKCYAVGDSGAVFMYDRGTWTEKSRLTDRILRRVAMVSATEGWAVGDGGTILRCFKDSWTLVPSPTTNNLRGLAVAGTSEEAWAVGDSGTILHCTMDSWHLEPFSPDPPDVPLYTVSFNSGNHGWAFGYKTYGERVALHYYDPVAIEEGAAARREPASSATVIGGILRIGDRGPGTGDRAELLDITGRRVMSLQHGASDVSRLAPGVYVLRDGLEITRRIVVTR